ncbi:MAG TPA: hypothetical protein VIH61_09250 [Waddliaceae bacterium]
MRTVFLSVFVFISAFSTAVYADNFSENDLLVQLYSLQDSSILDVKEGKFYINSEKISIFDNRICLNSDFFGPLALGYVIQDIEGMYVGLYYYYTCDNCSRSYQSEPAKCGTCGGTSFTRHDQSPGED